MLDRVFPGMYPSDYCWQQRLKRVEMATGRYRTAERIVLTGWVVDGEVATQEVEEEWVLAAWEV